MRRLVIFLIFLSTQNAMAVTFTCHLENENATAVTSSPDALHWDLRLETPNEVIHYETVHTQSTPYLSRNSPRGFTVAGHANTSAGVLTIHRTDELIDHWAGTFARIENSTVQLFTVKCLRSD